jgi:hypothetical protein
MDDEWMVYGWCMDTVWIVYDRNLIKAQKKTQRNVEPKFIVVDNVIIS